MKSTSLSPKILNVKVGRSAFLTWYPWASSAVKPLIKNMCLVTLARKKKDKKCVPHSLPWLRVALANTSRVTHTEIPNVYGATAAAVAQLV